MDFSFEETKKEWHGSLKAYMIGLILSLLLTSLSFSFVIFRPLSEQATIYTILGLALLQALVQLIFFLHLGQEDKPKWESLISSFVFIILLAIVLGSLWIMYDLGMRMMPMESAL